MSVYGHLEKIVFFLENQGAVDADREKCYTVSKFMERVVL